MTVSAVLSGAFAGLAAASAPGHKLHPGTTAPRTLGTKRSQATAAGEASTAIPPLPPPPGPGNLSGAPPSAPAPAQANAPTATQAPPVAVSGGS